MRDSARVTQQVTLQDFTLKAKHIHFPSPLAAISNLSVSTSQMSQELQFSLKSEIKILDVCWSFGKREKQNPKVYKKQAAETALCVVSKVIFIQCRGVGSKGMGKL